MCERIGESAIEKPNHRHCGLLRARRERPSSRSAERREERAPFQLTELHSVPCQHRIT